MDNLEKLKALVPKSEEKPQSELDKCREQLTQITLEFGGFANIPINHEYWEIRKKYQSLRNK